MNEKYVGGSDAAPGALQAIREGRSAEPTSHVATSVLPAAEYNYLDLVAATDQTFTLGTMLDGTKKSVMLRTKTGAGSAVVAGVFDGGTTITFDTVGEYVVLQFMVGKWRVIKNTGVLA